jgi:hypothetical protein
LQWVGQFFSFLMPCFFVSRHQLIYWEYDDFFMSKQKWGVMKKLIAAFAVFMAFGSAFAVPAQNVSQQQSASMEIKNCAQADMTSAPQNAERTDFRNMMQLANSACGFAPFPPLGCRLGNCVCDQYRNCQWTFICK